MVHNGNEVDAYERPTLRHLHQTATEAQTPFYALYLHTKGVTNASPPVSDWVDYMLYFALNRHEDVMSKLSDGFDACGVEYTGRINSCYAGNFWWATSTYIATLKQEFLDCKDYLAPELWVLSNPSHNAACMWSLNRNLYTRRHFPHEYQSQT